MEALRVLFTSWSGVLSIAGFVAMMGMAAYLFLRLRKLSGDTPGKKGWT